MPFEKILEHVHGLLKSGFRLLCIWIQNFQLDLMNHDTAKTLNNWAIDARWLVVVVVQ